LNIIAAKIIKKKWITHVAPQRRWAKYTLKFGERTLMEEIILENTGLCRRAKLKCILKKLDVRACTIFI
jgi:hypothetical protein